MEIKEIGHEDIEDVLRIYHQGILTGCATFQTEVPSVDEWNKAHLQFLCIFDRHEHKKRVPKVQDELQKPL